MAQFINMFEVDLQKSTHPMPLRAIVGEGDSNGLRVGAYVTNGGAAVNLGGSCVVKVVRADGATVQLTGTISGNSAYAVLDQQSCAVEGPIQVAICWVSGTNITTLVLAYGTVINTQTGTAIQPSTPIPDLTQLLAEIDEMREATAAAEAVSGETAILEDAVDDIENDFYNSEYSVGSFIFKHIQWDGSIADNNNKNIVFAEPVRALKGSRISVDSGYKYQLGLYNINTAAFVERVTWQTTPYVLDTDYLIRIELSDSSETVLVDTSISEHLHYKLYSEKFIPTRLNEIGFIPKFNIGLNYPIGTVVDLTPSSVAWYRYALINCSEGDVFLINATGGNNPRVWGFLDADDKLLAVADSSTVEQAQSNLIIVAPSGASKLVINDQQTNKVCYAYEIAHSNRYHIEELTKDVEELSEDISTGNTNVGDQMLVQMSNIVKAMGTSAIKGKTFDVVKPNKYTAWPFVVPVNGKILCLYSRGLSHEDASTPAIYAKTSYDGVAWSLEKNIIDADGVRDTICGKGNLPNGDAVFWNRVGTPGGSESVFDLYKTSDGATFTKIARPTFSIVVGHIGDIIQVESVGLMAFFNTYGNSRSWGIVTSSDGGLTWTLVTVESGLTKYECPTEISGVYLGNGRIIAIGRKDDYLDDPTYKQFQLQSSDYGSTWTRQYTNITDINASTPSLLYDSAQSELHLYYFQRGVGALRLRKSSVSSVWNNPTNWANSTVISYGTTNVEDAGNVNATTFGDLEIAAYYSGDSTNTGIYAVIE